MEAIKRHLFLVVAVVFMIESVLASVARKVKEDDIPVEDLMSSGTEKNGAEIKAGETTDCTENTCIGCAVGIILACLLIGILLGGAIVVLLRLRRHNSQTGIRLSTLKRRKHADEEDEHEIIGNYEQLSGLSQLIVCDDENEICRALERSKYADFLHLMEMLHTTFPREKLEHFCSSKDLAKMRRNIQDSNDEERFHEKRIDAMEKIHDDLQKEIDASKQILKSFSVGFQEEASPLLDKRYKHVEDDFQLFTTLLQNYHYVARIARDEQLLVELLRLKADIEDDEHFIKFCHQLHLTTKAALEIFHRNIRNIEHQSTRRKQRAMVYLGRKQAEKRSWNKMINGINNLARSAKRRSYISKENKRLVVEQVVQHMTSAKKRYVAEQQKAYRDLMKAVKAKKRQLEKTALYEVDEKKSSEANEVLRVGKMCEVFHKNEAIMDEFILKELQTVNGDLSKQISLQIRYAREKMKSLLLEKGVNEIWLDQEINSLKKEGESLLEDEGTEEEEQLDVNFTLPTIKVEESDDKLKMIEHLQAMQPSLESTQRWKCRIAEVATLRTMMTNGPRKMIEERLDMMIRLIATKREHVTKVPELVEVNEDEMFDQLDLKLQAWMQPTVETKDFIQRTQICAGEKFFLGLFIRKSITRNIQIVSHENEKRAMEVLFMESLRLLVQKKIFATSECKSVLHEHKSQYEQVRKTFDAMMNSREVELRKTIEINILQRNAVKSSQNNEISTNSLMYMGQRTIEDYMENLKEERLALQKLSLLQMNTYNEKLKALLEKEILLTRTLARTGDFNRKEINDCLSLMIPEKSANYLTKISNVICQEQSEAESASRSLYNRIKAMMELKLEAHYSHNSSRHTFDESSSASGVYEKYSYDDYARGTSRRTKKGKQKNRSKLMIR